jgi:hypothetical protein
MSTLIHGAVSCLNALSDKRELIQAMIDHGRFMTCCYRFEHVRSLDLVAIELPLIQEQLNFSNADRTMINLQLELMSLLDRDLTHVLDVVKRALQVKKTGAGDSDLPGIAEKLLQMHKPLVTLLSPLINLVS